MDTQTRTMNQDHGLTPLMTCIKKKDFKAADTLLKNGADVGVFHERLGSALHLACLTPRVPKDLVKKLISPELINAPNPVDGNTPLHCVVTKYANLKLVPLLLENNADRNAKNKAGIAPFMTVILEHLKYNDRTVRGRSEYIVEKYRAFLAILPSLLTKENIDFVYGKQRSTALVMTLDNHNLQCAQMLLDHGADPSICSLSDSALHIACRSYCVKCGYIQSKMFQSLLVPAVVNTMDWQGNTPLHLAIEAGNTKHVTMLLESNADIDMTNSEGFTPLMNALRLNRVKLAEQIWKRGADVTVTHYKRGFPLHLAFSQPNIPAEMFQSLLIPQAINHVNGYGDTPLHEDVNNNFNLVPMLLQRNADCNIRDNMGYTPLLNALKIIHRFRKADNMPSNCIDLVKLLIPHTNVDTECPWGMTPLAFAIASRYPLPAVDVILRLCTPRTVCWPRRPPLYVAVKRARWDLVPLLIARGADPNQTWELLGTPPRDHVTSLLCMFVNAVDDGLPLVSYEDGLPRERCESPPLSIYRQLITPKSVDTLYEGKCAVQYALENKQWEVIGLLIRCGLLRTGSLKLLSALAVRVKVLPEHPVPAQFKKYLEMDRLLKEYVRNAAKENTNNV